VLSLTPAALLLCIAGNFDINGLVTLETRAGEGPLTADGVIKPGVIGILTPDLQLSYLSRTAEMRLDYGARIFWRQPNDSSSLRPLILHAVNFLGSVQATRNLKLTGNVNASIGESDYTILTQILGPGQAALPTVADFFSATAAVGAQLNVSRTSIFGMSLAVTQRRPLGATANVPVVDPTMPPFPRQTSVVATPSFGFDLTRQDQLTLVSPMSYGTYSGGIDILTVSPQVRWRAHLTSNYDLRIGAGIAYARVEPALPTSSPVAPVGEVGVETRLADTGAVATRASAGVRVDYFVDPVLGTAGPRASLVLGLWSTLTPDWFVGFDGNYSTVFLGTNTSVLATLTDETAASVAIPVRYRASDNILTEFGFRWSDRAPSVLVSAFGFHQRQLWLYLLLTATTRRPTTRMVQ
jgi:hypothetical protein